MLRWIDELNGVTDADYTAKRLRSQIKDLRHKENNIQNRREIKRLYSELDNIQFKPDYMCLIIDKPKDYYRASKGFTINGVRYKRLLGTNGGIKNSTIVFVSERLSDEIHRRIENGRNPNKELVTAKLEAYKALSCSASNPVSLPKGILVVNDAETEFLSDIIYLTDESEGEPIMKDVKDFPVKLNASDGFGLMLPSLAERWSRELGLDYLVAGVNTRFSFEKGMVFTFDFVEFAEKIAGTYMVRDAWGSEVDIRDVELILTTSMVKLWDSYDSCFDYINKSTSNGYTFGITKTCPKELENERNLNYQFIQSYDLSEDDIDRLIEPTMSEIKDVLGGDWKKTVLFLKGSGLSEKNVSGLTDDFIKGVMIDKSLLSDPFIQNKVYQLIRNRIDQAKYGVLKVHGNYSVVSGDPFLLCQNIFGLEKTGLLKAGEIYNKYWVDRSSKSLACFRAPMTCHNNIRLVHPVGTVDTLYWYRYMNTVTILNAWDTTTAALNGCDFDGDIVMLTDNDVLVSRLKPLPTLMCAQRNAKKRMSSEDDFIKSNIESFGNDIGQTTNWITSMFEVRAGYEPNTPEYEMLSYRIKCGQLFQQNAIDKAKGIICKPMPRCWHDRYAAKDNALYRSIVADKKPYFMRYIYPALMKQYNTYIKNTNKNALREFCLTVQELYEIPEERCTERQKEFLTYYELKMPVGMNNCVMNSICRKFEEQFDGYLSRFKSDKRFDYTVLKSDTDYSVKQFYEIKKLYEEYNKRLANYAAFTNYEKVDSYSSSETIQTMSNEFVADCLKICSNEDALCNIALDLCYKRSSTKQFAWDICGRQIIHNLLKKNNYELSFPRMDSDGDIQYCGERYSIKTIQLKEDNIIDGNA